MSVDPSHPQLFTFEVLSQIEIELSRPPTIVDRLVYVLVPYLLFPSPPTSTSYSYYNTTKFSLVYFHCYILYLSHIWLQASSYYLIPDFPSLLFEIVIYNISSIIIKEVNALYCCEACRFYGIRREGPKKYYLC